MAELHFRDLRDLLSQTEKKYSDEIAFKMKYRNEVVGIKYSKFIEDIKGLGSYLTTLDLTNKRVGIFSENRYEWNVSYLAVATANMTVIPVDKALPSNEFNSIVERSDMEVLIFDKKHLPLVEEQKKMPNNSIKYYIGMDDDFNQKIEQGKIILGRKDNKYNKIKIENDKMKFMLFTSGTTSRSKCVMLSHRNICSNIEAISEALDVTPNDTLLSFLPAHHTFECTAGFLYPIAVGAKIAFCEGLRHMVDNMKDFEVTCMISVPLLYEGIYKKLWKQIEKSKKETQIKVALKASEALLKVGIDMRRQLFKQVHEALGGKIRLFVSGAAGINPEVSKGYNDFGFIMFQGYGLTETSPVVSVERYDIVKNGSVGKPLKKVEVKIDKPDNDGIGEIWVKAPSVMLGYYNDKENTDNVMEHGWFKTGDLGKIDDEGFVYITGRKKDVIVLKNGKNVFPDELEALLGMLPCIKESIVYGYTADDGDVEIRAKLVYDKDEFVETIGIMQDEEVVELYMKKIKELNKKMPTYKYIKQIIVTDEPLIKTTTNKVKRHEEIKKILQNNK